MEVDGVLALRRARVRPRPAHHRRPRARRRGARSAAARRARQRPAGAAPAASPGGSARVEDADLAARGPRSACSRTRTRSRLLARAYELSLAGEAAVGRGAVPGVSEIELYSAAQATAQIEAGSPVDFGADLLVGARTALVCGPVATPGLHRAEDGDVVVADVSVRHGGYWGDTARTFVVGDNPEAREVMASIREVLDQTAELLRPGTRAQRGLRLRRRPRSRGATPTASSRTTAGHGVGITGYEPPHLVPGDETVLARGHGLLGRARRVLRGPLRRAPREHLRGHRPRRRRPARRSTGAEQMGIWTDAWRSSPAPARASASASRARWPTRARRSRSASATRSRARPRPRSCARSASTPAPTSPT